MKTLKVISELEGILNTAKNLMIKSYFPEKLDEEDQLTKIDQIEVIEEEVLKSVKNAYIKLAVDYYHKNSEQENEFKANIERSEYIMIEEGLRVDWYNPQHPANPSKKGDKYKFPRDMSDLDFLWE